MKFAMHLYQDAVPTHVRLFSQAELRTLLIMAILVGIVFDLFG